MSELLAPPAGRPGRRQTVTAKAWISRPNGKAPFVSHVSLGKGKVHTRQTQTYQRGTALDFNRTHLLDVLCRKIPAQGGVHGAEQLALLDPEVQP
jgi:hypothetical protein